MSGFEKQTYTQVPNSLFEVMNEMDECELKVVLYICRYTFGYHREEVKISTRKLARAIKMSVASVDKGAGLAVKRGLIERVTDGQNTTLWRAIVSDSKNDTQESDSDIDTDVIQKMNQDVPNNESQVGIKERIKKGKKGDLVDGMAFYAQQAKEHGEDKVEEIIQELERGLKVNIDRSLKNQVMAKKIIKDGRPLSQWISWAKADEWRAAHLYLYAKLEKVWQDFPQAFNGDDSMNPQGLQVGF